MGVTPALFQLGPHGAAPEPSQPMTSSTAYADPVVDTVDDITSWRPLFEPCRFLAGPLSNSPSDLDAAEALLLSVQSKIAVLLESGMLDDEASGRLDCIVEELGAGALEHRGAGFVEVSLSTNGREAVLEVLHNGESASPWTSDVPGASMILAFASRIHHSHEGGICRTAAGLHL